MLLFFCVAALSTLLMFAAGRVRPAAGRLALAMASVAVPVLAAGARDASVGTDVGIYLVFMAQGAQDMGFADFMAYYADTSAAGFNALLWPACRLGGLALAMGVLQLVCAAPVYAELWRQGPRHAWAGVLAYCLVLFPPSLNAMKQFAAMGVCLFCFRYMRARRPWPLFAGVLAATQLHQSAAIFAAAYPAYLLVCRCEERRPQDSRWMRALPMALVALLLAAAFALLPPVLELLPAFKDSYLFFSRVGGTDLNLSALTMLAVVGACAASVLRDPAGIPAGRRPDLAFFALMTCAGFALFQLNMIAFTLMRVGFVPLMFLPCLASALAASSSRAHRAVLAILLAFLVAYLVVVVAVNGGYGVYPFTSALLGVA